MTTGSEDVAAADHDSEVSCPAQDVRDVEGSDHAETVAAEASSAPFAGRLV